MKCKVLKNKWISKLLILLSTDAFLVNLVEKYEINVCCIKYKFLDTPMKLISSAAANSSTNTGQKSNPSTQQSDPGPHAWNTASNPNT